MIKANNPLQQLDDATTELKHLASLCRLLSCIQGEHSVISMEVVQNTMVFIWEHLEQQITALESIKL